MNVVFDYPPNWKELNQFFQGIDETTVAVTYGDTVYVPGGWEMEFSVKAHEETHIRQQRISGAALWWNQYYINPSFRLEQELEAYRVQYKSLQGRNKDRNKLAKSLSFFAKHLSSPIYGNMVSYTDALKLIRTGR